MRAAGGLTICAALVGCASPSTHEAPAAIETSVAPLGPLRPTSIEARHENGSPVVVARLRGRRIVFVADGDESRIISFNPEPAASSGTRCSPAFPRSSWSGATGGSTPRCARATRMRDPRGHRRARVAPDAGSGAHRDRAGGARAGRRGAHAARHLGVGARARRVRHRALDPALHGPARARAARHRPLRGWQTAFVSHAVGSVLSAVDFGRQAVRTLPLDGSDYIPALPKEVLECLPKAEQADRAHVNATRRPGIQGFAIARLGDRMFVPQVLARTGNPSLHTDGYGHSVGALPSHVFSVAVVEPEAKAPTRGSVHLDAEPTARKVARRNECRLPRAAAFNPARGSLFVACVDMDAVVELDAGESDPAHAEKRRFATSAGPVGLAVDPEQQEVYVWSQFEQALDVLPLGEPKTSYAAQRLYARVKIPAERLPSFDDPRVARGRELFHTSGDPRIAKDGRACASCHPDGRDDGLTWATPSGPRQPPMLAGRLAGTAPYSWASQHETVKDHLQHTFKLLHGTGLDEGSLDALILYVTTLRGRSRTPRPADARERRGREIFASVDVGVHQLPPRELGVERRLDARRLVTRGGGRHHQVRHALAPVRGGTGPYFHDGRYATLRQLLAATDGAMGNTRHLGEGDLQALEAYLQSL